MPTCSVCGAKAYSDRCFRHKPKAPIQRLKRPRPGKHTIKDRVENKKFRDSKLTHEGYLVCECCGSWQGSDADHIKGKGSNPDKRYDPANKRILCRNCHDNVTNNRECKHESLVEKNT